MHRDDNNRDGESPSGDGPEGTRRRVLLLIKCLGYGGAERLLVYMVRHRDQSRFDYEVAYVLENENALVPDLTEAGVPVHSLGARSNRDLGWTVRLRTLLREGNFDIMHSHLPHAATLGRLAAASLGPRRRPALVSTQHSTWNRLAVALRILNRATIGLDDRVLVVSQAARDSLPPSLQRRATVVIHGIEMEPVHDALAEREDLRRSVRAEFGLVDGELLALTIANLRVEKGLDVLLRAAHGVRARGLPVRFVVAGRGPLAGELESHRAALGLGDSLRFVGERDDVLRLLAGADMFVLPSRHEGLPVVMMEATAMGAAIVVTDVGEMSNLWTNGVDAVIVPPESPGALADAVASVGQDAELRARLAAGSLERAGLFDVTRCVREVETIYDELVPVGRGTTRDD